MTDRVRLHYQSPVTDRLLNHVLYNIGLSEKDRELVMNLRKYTGNTQFYADLSNMSVKQYSERMGKIHTRIVNELLRLSEIALIPEKNSCFPRTV